jgi:hypothetical protein
MNIFPLTDSNPTRMRNTPMKKEPFLCISTSNFQYCVFYRTPGLNSLEESTGLIKV